MVCLVCSWGLCVPQPFMSNEGMLCLPLPSLTFDVRCSGTGPWTVGIRGHRCDLLVLVAHMVLMVDWVWNPKSSGRCVVGLRSAT